MTAKSSFLEMSLEDRECKKTPLVWFWELCWVLFRILIYALYWVVDMLGQEEVRIESVSDLERRQGDQAKKVQIENYCWTKLCPLIFCNNKIKWNEVNQAAKQKLWNHLNDKETEENLEKTGSDESKVTVMFDLSHCVFKKWRRKKQKHLFL